MADKVRCPALVDDNHPIGVTVQVLKVDQIQLSDHELHSTGSTYVTATSAWISDNMILMEDACMTYFQYGLELIDDQALLCLLYL